MEGRGTDGQTDRCVRRAVAWRGGAYAAREWGRGRGGKGDGRGKADGGGEGGMVGGGARDELGSRGHIHGSVSACVMYIIDVEATPFIQSSVKSDRGVAGTGGEAGKEVGER